MERLGALSGHYGMLCINLVVALVIWSFILIGFIVRGANASDGYGLFLIRRIAVFLPHLYGCSSIDVQLMKRFATLYCNCLLSDSPIEIRYRYGRARLKRLNAVEPGSTALYRIYTGKKNVKSDGTEKCNIAVFTGWRRMMVAVLPRSTVSIPCSNVYIPCSNVSLPYL